MGHNVVSDDGKFKVACVYAVDWTMFGEQMRLSDIDDMEILHVLVTGFVVREDDDYLCLSQQIFDDEGYSIRFTVMIPKMCILEQWEMNLGEYVDGMADGFDQREEG
jgi:hypothetical protein